jgi:hydrogenase/urease accessory protein HupE
MTGTQKCETYGHSSQRFKLASRFLPAACWLLLTAFSTAQAHDPGLSAADLRLTERGLIATLTLARTDIEQLCWIDSDRDGNISAAEFDSARPKLEELARNALKVRIDDRESKPSFPKVEIDDSNAVHFQLSFPAMSGSRLSVRSVILANLARGHKEYFSLKDERGNVIVEQILDRSRDQIELNLEQGLSSARVGESFGRFLKLGVEHIFTGYDHLAFLFALLLAGATFREVARIITSFTLAHSFTLALATFNIVHLPSAVVEPLIAVSIIYVGVENLVRRRLDRRWLLTFAFGLVHGLGFASVLREFGIGAQAGQALPPLLSFNLGVELGQISIAALVLPLIWRLKRRPEFVMRYAPACSVLMALLGSYWLIERTLLK